MAQQSATWRLSKTVSALRVSLREYLVTLIISVSRRLKSVKSIQKITKSMKMVSAAKYAKAERELRAARSYGMGAKGSCTHT